MTDFSASQFCSQPRHSACPSSSCVIVNARRVPACPGATGSVSVTRFGKSARLAFILSSIQAGALKDGRFCTPAELKDSRGLPVMIVGIPSRTKGGEPCHGHGQNGAPMPSLEACLAVCHTCHACEDKAWQTASRSAVLRPAAFREGSGFMPAGCSVQGHGFRPRRPRRPEGWRG
ncbi:MAG: hypothetical protein K6E40_02900 [Desulfovibrio sp.]|nr:hypothetical protein [Desulfovibrio sp.]